jgi:ubiquinone/menaquinone biosynthesis C-methylase UbiE
MASASPPRPRGHRWYAAAYDTVNWWAETRLFARYRPWIAGEASGRVLEIGAGTGANFPYYRAAALLVAAEPDPFMLCRARARAHRLGLAVRFCQCPAEALPFADASFDAVVATLVLCTVNDPARALAEVRRVLKPDGTFRFIEHVRADGFAGAVQDLVTPVWRWVGAGCHPNRRTATSIRAAGFEIIACEERPLPLTPLIIGLARPRAFLPTVNSLK